MSDSEEQSCPLLDTRVPHLLSLARAHDPLIMSSTPSMSRDSLIPPSTLSMSLLKTQLYSAMIRQPAHSLGRLSLSMLESLVSLSLEDLVLAGHPGNIWDYLDSGMAAMHCLPTGSKYLALDYLARTKASVRARKGNIDNRMEADDVEKINFLNRLDQMEHSLAVLRTHLLTSLLWSSCRMEPGSLSPSRGSSKDEELNNNLGRENRLRNLGVAEVLVDSSGENPGLSRVGGDDGSPVRRVGGMPSNLRVARGQVVRARRPAGGLSGLQVELSGSNNSGSSDVEISFPPHDGRRGQIKSVVSEFRIGDLPPALTDDEETTDDEY